MTSKNGERLKKALEDEQNKIDGNKNKAIEISENGDPIKFVLDVHQSIHVGDRGTGKILIASIGCQSVLNSDGIHPKGSGKSGKGKTHCFKAMLHLVPKKWKEMTTLSDKAIYYMNLEKGMIIYSDDVLLSEGLEGVIKRSTSNFQEGDVHTTIDANRKNLKLFIPPRVAWWLTSVDDLQSSQLSNRQFGVDVDESEDQDLKVLEFQKRIAKYGIEKFPENDDIEVCRCIIDDVKSQVHRVKIPFADAIIWKYPGNRRNFDIFLDMIRSFAAWRYKQRTTDDDGFLIADIEDYYEAESLYLTKAKEQTSKLNKTEYRILQTIMEIGECSLTALQKATGISKGRLSQIMHGKNGSSGLLEKVETLTEDEISDRIGDRYYRQKVYTVSGFDSFINFEKAVSIDTTLLSCIPEEKVNASKTCQQITNIKVNASVNDRKTMPTDSESGEVNASNDVNRLPLSNDMQGSKKDNRLPSFTHRLPDEVNASINSSKDNNNINNQAFTQKENLTYIEMAVKILKENYDSMGKPENLEDSKKLKSSADINLQLEDIPDEIINKVIPDYWNVRGWPQ